MKNMVILLICIFVCGSLFSCGDEDSGTPGKVKEIISEFKDPTIGGRMKFVYEGDKVVGNVWFSSRLPLTTRYEYGRDEATSSDKISFYTASGEEPERLAQVCFIENGRIVKEVRDNVAHYKYQDDRISQVILLVNDSAKWYYSEYTYENGNLVMLVCHSMNGDEEIAGSRISYQFEYDSIPNNANIDLFAWGFNIDLCSGSKEGLNITGVRNRNLPSKFKNLKDNTEQKYIYELEDGYVTSYKSENWRYSYGEWVLYSGGGNTRIIYE